MDGWMDGWIFVLNQSDTYFDREEKDQRTLLGFVIQNKEQISK